MSDAAGQLAFIAGVLLSLAVIGRYVVLPLVRLVHGTMSFLEDWQGRDGQPGAMQQIAHVRAEVSYNHGTSIKDAVRRIETTQAVLLARFDQHITDNPHQP